ncbi:hypothetical protein I7819_01110 [Burkholderia multivorans]|uniref:hypothetical protein n=1 Tax=Burkholderia multivorans TaxID=87883 RepID=UPI001907AA78|nr:hypothetical protein [Burkholderia multivorans]MBJ9938474.1 hypothetical protein [Burkholderia multivorans]MBU9284412.1 hypothetical protein [Burkholderia multivorans]HDV6318717.1 hypothetical protein [Burkholderia multivorans]
MRDAPAPHAGALLPFFDLHVPSSPRIAQTSRGAAARLSLPCLRHAPTPLVHRTQALRHFRIAASKMASWFATLQALSSIPR